MVFYNPLDKFYKSILGAISTTDSITFRVKGNFDSVVFVFKNDKDDVFKKVCMEKISDYFCITFNFERGLYFYRFETDKGIIGLGADFIGELNSDSWFQLTVFDVDYKVPSWLKGGVIYQIFPDRFCRGVKNKNIEEGKFLHDNWLDTPVYNPNEYGKVLNNDFFGGDFKGIKSKLSYLKDLGVNAIYLNPIFKAYSNHRYDTGDYMRIDSLLGSEEDFVDLIYQADLCGIKIILDGVFNHTGDDSLYFNKYGNYDSLGAFQDKNSPYFDWFNFIDYPNLYESWWGITTLPSTNKTNSAFVDFITGKNGVIEYYTKLGIGGWRLDVVDELPSFLVKKIRDAVKRNNPDTTIIGEVWEDASNKISYGVRREYFQGYELDSVMNYPLKNAILDYVKSGDCSVLKYIIKEQLDHYPKQVLDNLMNILSTHDTVRLITALYGQDMHGKSKDEMSKTFIPKENLALAKFRVKVASLLQYTLCGVPSLYYGDEIGMQGYADPLNRMCYPWGNEDLELLDWYKFLGALRKDYDAFVDGDFCEIFADKGCLLFSRKGKSSEILIAINIGSEDVLIEFDDVLTSALNGQTYLEKIQFKTNSFDVLFKSK